MQHALHARLLGDTARYPDTMDERHGAWASPDLPEGAAPDWTVPQNWDQLTDEEARAQSPILFERRGNDKWHVRVPEGENYAEVAARVSDWVKELKTGTIAISHGATTRILRGLLTGLDWRAMSSLDEPQGVVFRVRGTDIAKLEP